MAKALLNGLIALLMKLIGILGSVFIYPLQLIIVNLFPEVGDYAATALNWLVGNIFPLITWIKTFILNVTGIPETLFQLVVAEFFLLITSAVAIRELMLIYRLYLFIRGKEI